MSLIKHAHHTFDVDQPGKDSYRHRHAGASEILVTSSRRWVLMHELRGAHEPPFEEQVKRISPCDLLLVEGFKFAPIPKLEVWRAETGEALLHPNDPHIVAVASDAKVETKLPCSISTMWTASRRSSSRSSSCMNQGLLSVDDALARLLAEAKPVPRSRRLPTLEATNRILARAQRFDHGRAADGQQRDGRVCGTNQRDGPERLRDRRESPRARSASRSSPGRLPASLPARRFRRAPMPS